GSEKLGRARFRVYGTGVRPDATFTARLNFGVVEGWKEDGQQLEPFTHLARLFERATGQEPFEVPDSWLALQNQLDPATRFDLSTNNDIGGGNSGSPLVDASSRHGGLMLAGHIQSVYVDCWFDAARTCAVH